MNTLKKNRLNESNYNSSPSGRLGGAGRLIKICGMKYPSNILEVAALNPDFMGFIFYPKSPRYAEPLDEKTLQVLPKSMMKIGVFVNESLDDILAIVKKYSLNGVQLHGNESDDLCYTLKAAGLIVIKAFAIAEASDFDATEDYEGTCDFYLFDTKTSAYGGSGQKFDWSMLSAYQGNTRFLLSGGILVEDSETVSQINHSKFAGVDLNSKFEIEPGMKDVELLKQFSPLNPPRGTL